MVSVTVISKGKKFTVKMDAADYNKYVKGKLQGILYTQGHAYARVGNSNQLLHRLIKGASGKLVVHHKNGGRLDNRRSNLELTTQAHNVAEQERSDPDDSGVVIGDEWSIASLTRDIATFLLRAASPDPIAARSAYSQAAEKHAAEFSARLGDICHVVDWALDNMLTGAYMRRDNTPLDRFISVLRLVQPDIPYLPDLDEYRTYFLKGPEWQVALRMEDESARTVVCNRIVREALSRIRSLQCVIADALREHQNVLDIAERPDGGVRKANEELQRRRTYKPRRSDMFSQGVRLFCEPHYWARVLEHVGDMISDVSDEMLPFCGPEINCYDMLPRHDARVAWFAELREERKAIEYPVEVIELD
ncbi:g10119 [Coccomyxa elongata]